MDWERLPWRLRYQYAARAMSEARRLSILATHRHTDVHIPKNSRVGPGFDLIMPGSSTFTVGPGVDFRRGFVAELADGARLEIGAACTFTSFALIQCSTSIVIGTRAVFGQNLMLADGNHRFRDHTRHLLDQGYDFRPITIGDGAIVTSKCTVLADIGKGAVIAANSVVTKPVPDYCLAAGAPARIVEYFGPADAMSDELRARLGGT